MLFVVYEWPESQLWLERNQDFEEGVYALEHSEHLNNPAVCVMTDLIVSMPSSDEEE